MDQDLIAAVEQRDWARAKLLLHPYLHWNEPGVILVRSEYSGLSFPRAERKRTSAPLNWPLAGSYGDV